MLILAHRGELLEQAADKIKKSTGLGCSVEKAEQTCIGSWFRVTVGSVQTLMRDKRLAGFKRDYFDTIVIDEAHHCISDSYQKVLGYFQNAKVLGVTATPDRGDMKDLGTYAAWKATKTTGQFDLKTFEVKALPQEKVEGLRPGMSVILKK